MRARRRGLALGGVKLVQARSLATFVRAESLLELRGEVVLSAHRRMARGFKPAGANLQAKRTIRGNAARGAAVGECSGICIEVKIVRGDGLEVGGLRVEPTGRASVLGAGGHGVRLASQTAILGVEPVVGSILLGGALLASGDVVGARPRALTNDESVVLRGARAARPDAGLHPGQGPADVLRERAEHERLDRDRVGRRGRLPRARHEVTAGRACVEHARGVVAETLEGARGGGVDGIGTATAPPLERVGCSSWERVGVNTAEAPTPVDGAGDPGADPEPAP